MQGTLGHTLFPFTTALCLSSIMFYYRAGQCIEHILFEQLIANPVLKINCSRQVQLIKTGSINSTRFCSCISMHIHMKTVCGLKPVSLSNLLNVMAVKFLASGFMCSSFELKETQQTIKMLSFFE